MNAEQHDLIESLAARRFFANRLEAHFRAHLREWIDLPTLMRIGGPSWRSRIACDLRKKRGLVIVWNRDSRQSAYMCLEQAPQGRDASVPAADRWPVVGAPYEEPFVLTPPEAR